MTPTRNRTMTLSICQIGLVAFAGALALSMTAPAMVAAQTDPKATADEHFRKGVAAFRERRFGDAAPEFEEAYRLSPAYAVLYNIGQVNVALGRSVEAVDAFERYLKQGASEIPAERVREVQAEVAKQMDRIGTVVVRTAPEGAEVRMDGRAVGKTPLPRPLHLTVGKHVFEAFRPGYVSEGREVEVMGRAERVIQLKLEPTPSGAEPGDGASEKARSAPPSAPPPAVTVVQIPRFDPPPASPSPPPPMPKAAPTNWQRVIGYVVIAGGLATTTVGGLRAYDGWNRMNDADDRLRNVTQAQYDALKPQHDLDYAAAKHDNHVGWTVAGVGAAVLLGGVIVLATAPDRSASVALGVGPTKVASADGLGLELAGTW